MRILFALLFSLFGSTSGFAQSVFPALAKTASGTVTVYSSLDENVSKPLIAAFQTQNPTIAVNYHDLQSLDIYERVINETDKDNATADLLISSAMDLQVKLANDGYAQPARPVPAVWPKWAQWRDSVFGLTFEPSVIVYHKPSFIDQKPPANRTALSQLLLGESDDYFGRVGTYDIERSGLGFLFLARDTEHDRNLWKLVNSLGKAGVKLYSSSSAILERIADGRLAIGYNILGSYAQAWTTNNPAIGIVLPEDFTVVMSRIALVPQAARQPTLGKRLLTFLMSKEGQTIMAKKLKLPALHPAVKDINTATAFREKFDSRLRPIPIGPGLLAYLDQVKRSRFIRRWNKALRGE